MSAPKCSFSKVSRVCLKSLTRDVPPHCDLRVRWKVARHLRFQAEISEPEPPSFCGISGDLAPSMRKSLAIAIVRFWCAKISSFGGADWTELGGAIWTYESELSEGLQGPG